MSNKEVLLVFGVIIALFVFVFRYKQIERFLFNRKHSDDFVPIGFSSMLFCLCCMAIRTIIYFAHAFAYTEQKPIDNSDFDSLWGVSYNGLPIAAGVAVLVGVVKILKFEKGAARILSRCIYVIAMCSLACALGFFAGFLIIGIFLLWIFWKGITKNRVVIYH